MIPPLSMPPGEERSRMLDEGKQDRWQVIKVGVFRKKWSFRKFSTTTKAQNLLSDCSVNIRTMITWKWICDGKRCNTLVINQLGENKDFQAFFCWTFTQEYYSAEELHVFRAFTQILLTASSQIERFWCRLSSGAQCFGSWQSENYIHVGHS